MGESAQASLTTAEELLLLAIDPRTGQLHSHPKFRLQAALAGAVLLDLLADGSITLVDDRVLAAVGRDDDRSAPVERIRNLPTSHSLAWWVDAFGFSGAEAKAWPIASLAEKRVIKVQKQSWLPPFPRIRYQLIDPQARSGVATKVVKAVRTARQPDPQATALTVMAAECGLVKVLLTRSERPALSERVNALLRGQASSTRDTLTSGNWPTVVIQVYEAVYSQGLAGVMQGT